MASIEYRALQARHSKRGRLLHRHSCRSEQRALFRGAPPSAERARTSAVRPAQGPSGGGSSAGRAASSAALQCIGTAVSPPPCTHRRRCIASPLPPAALNCAQCEMRGRSITESHRRERTAGHTHLRRDVFLPYTGRSLQGFDTGQPEHAPGGPHLAGPLAAGEGVGEGASEVPCRISRVLPRAIVPHIRRPSHIIPAASDISCSPG